MDKKYAISFIVSTKNRLPFLKILEEHIFNNLNEVEEVIVIDGDSSDGSKEYLAKLLNDGKIHQLVSEPDVNQAHGWNKGFLLAKGEIIKKLIDDDVHDLAAIRRCADYMAAHPEVDLCISDCLVTSVFDPKKIRHSGRLDRYMRWKNGETHCFPFGDVYLLIRRSQLSRFGLFDVQFRMMDWEYSLRCSYLNANISYYTGCNALTVDTPGNITSTATKNTLRREAKIGAVKYNYAGDRSDISWISEFKIFVGKMLDLAKGKEKPSPDKLRPLPDELELARIYNDLYDYLRHYNAATEFQVIYK